jgi:hypothetical protein
MKNQMYNKSSVPISIKLIFDNEKLDLMKLLCLINAFSNHNKKKSRKISEVLFYYSLVNFELIRLFDKEKGIQKSFSPSPNLYFRFQTKINKLLLCMSHLKFIEIKGDTSLKFDDIKIKLSPIGKQFFENHNTDYFLNLHGKYINTFNKVEFSIDNLKIIKGIQS